MQKDRIAYIDFLKGICIILIVIPHVNQYIFDTISPRLSDALISIRMPMFFFLSGLFFKTYSGFSDYLRKKVNGLIVTLLFFHFVCCFFQYPLALIINHFRPDLDVHFGLIDFIPPIFGRYWRAAGALWFLASLFGMSILYYLFQKYLSQIGVLIAVIISSVIGYELMRYKIELPFEFDTALVGVPFFMLGAVVKQYNFLAPSRYDKWGILVVIPCMLIYYFTCSEIDLFKQLVPSYIELYAVQFLAILSLFWCCKNLGYVPLICYYGRYSIIILGTHQVLIGYVDSALRAVGLSGITVSISTIIIVMILEIFVIKFMITYFPRFTAQQDFFKPGWKLNTDK